MVFSSSVRPRAFGEEVATALTSSRADSGRLAIAASDAMLLYLARIDFRGVRSGLSGSEEAGRKRLRPRCIARSGDEKSA